MNSLLGVGTSCYNTNGFSFYFTAEGFPIKYGPKKMNTKVYV